MNILITLAGKSLRFVSEGYTKDKFLLDIGAGDCALTNVIGKKLGINVVAVDIDDDIDWSGDSEDNCERKILYDGSTSLPSDLGDKNLLLINAMESAMQEGHSNENKKIIRNYFMKLQNEK